MPQYAACTTRPQHASAELSLSLSLSLPPPSLPSSLSLPFLLSIAFHSQWMAAGIFFESFLALACSRLPAKQARFFVQHFPIVHPSSHLSITCGSHGLSCIIACCLSFARLALCFLVLSSLVLLDGLFTVAHPDVGHACSTACSLSDTSPPSTERRFNCMVSSPICLFLS